jgi:hypothetical protein
MNHEDIARIAHEANRAVRSILGEGNTQSWDEAPEHIRQSIMDGVRYRLANPHASDAENHENWRVYKLSQGWTVGSREDIPGKIHPNLVPFEQLSEDQRAKDSLFGAIVKALTPFLRSESEPTASLKQPNWGAVGGQT